MEFTDKFVKVPIDLVNNHLEEITGKQRKEDFIHTYAMINPFDISYYRPAMDDTMAFTDTAVYFKNGDNLLITLTIKQFESLLNTHQKHD